MSSTQAERAVNQLYDSDTLRSELRDEEASLLLSWGESRITELAQRDLPDSEFNQLTEGLRSLLAAINVCVGKRKTSPSQHLSMMATISSTAEAAGFTLPPDEQTSFLRHQAGLANQECISELLGLLKPAEIVQPPSVTIGETVAELAPEPLAPMTENPAPQPLSEPVSPAAVNNTLQQPSEPTSSVLDNTPPQPSEPVPVPDAVDNMLQQPSEPTSPVPDNTPPQPAEAVTDGVDNTLQQPSEPTSPVLDNTPPQPSEPVPVPDAVDNMLQQPSEPTSPVLDNTPPQPAEAVTDGVDNTLQQPSEPTSPVPDNTPQQPQDLPEQLPQPPQEG